MKKIDLHVHTISTVSDNHFTFCKDTLKRYVTDANLDAIAITNHNIFDAQQFRDLKELLQIVVFPGIEINLDEGHIILISDGSNIEDFESRSNEVFRRVSRTGSITVRDLKDIYGNLQNYLIIPHYDKSPSIRVQTLEELLPYLAAGEVDSAKKFIRAIKDETKLTPVLFSDVRVSDKLNELPTRQTFLDCGELTLSAIRACLGDKRKVSLSKDEGNFIFQIFDDGQKISTGLNVLLGERSTGKTYTLNKINNVSERAKYIKQFSLVQLDEEAYEREFNKDIQKKRSGVIDDYLSAFKAVLDDVMKVDLESNKRDVENYISTLCKSAEEADRRDAYSKVALFDETAFPDKDDKILRQLIESVRHVIENLEYKEIIERYVDIQSLKKLACELIELLWSKALENRKKRFINGLIKDIKGNLKMRSSAIQVDDVDLYQVTMEARKVARFSDIVNHLQRESVIFEESVQGFRVVASKGPFQRAGELRNTSVVKTAFKEAMKEYGNPYRYLKALMSDPSLPKSELYKLFTKIEYNIINRDGFEVSGGERSEFRLLQEIQDAQSYDILLIDEPESSFDNMFLKSDVNQIIREISKSMPVVVVTHNNTVGASVGADYLLYAIKTIENGVVTYRIYSGHPMDKVLKSVDGQFIKTHEIMMNSLEAGRDAYQSRRHRYEAIED
ncbi:MAG TPA: PHP domain-containing protein [Syntrophales bacterium]|nr:PHP domain-containing protein [Syntrophales bacterium]